MAGVEGAGFGTIDIANQVSRKRNRFKRNIRSCKNRNCCIRCTGLGLFVIGAGRILTNKIINLKLQKNNNLNKDKLKKHSKKLQIIKINLKL